MDKLMRSVEDAWMEKNEYVIQSVEQEPNDVWMDNGVDARLLALDLKSVEILTSL
jgi:hypothetical protein